MARPIGAKDSAIGLSEIIDTAKSTIVLVSPYVQLSYSHKRKLSEASEQGKRILLVCRKEDLYPNQLEELQRIRNLKLLDHANVHAKCYFNESKLLITSLNFYNHSIQNNVELGTWFDNTESQEKFSRSLSDAISALNIPELNLELAKIFSKGELEQKFDRNKFEETYKLFSFRPIAGEKGFCIRCASKLQYLNGNYPLCSDCFVEWSREYDFQAQEKCCHWCGVEKATSKAKPLCYPCFTKYKLTIKVGHTTTDKSATIAEVKRETIPTFNREEPSAENHSNKVAPKQRNYKSAVIGLTTLLVLSSGAIWLFNSGVFKAQQQIGQKNDLETLVRNYYRDLDKGPENVLNYFGPTVENYIQAENLDPQDVVTLIETGVKEFSYPKTVILDSAFLEYKDSKGRQAVSFWIDFECYRKSKKQFQKCLVQEEFILDDKLRIVSVKELEVKNLRFSYDDPK